MLKYIDTLRWNSLWYGTVTYQQAWPRNLFVDQVIDICLRNRHMVANSDDVIGQNKNESHKAHKNIWN